MKWEYNDEEYWSISDLISILLHNGITDLDYLDAYSLLYDALVSMKVGDCIAVMDSFEEVTRIA